MVMIGLIARSLSPAIIYPSTEKFYQLHFLYQRNQGMKKMMSMKMTTVDYLDSIRYH